MNLYMARIDKCYEINNHVVNKNLEVIKADMQKHNQKYKNEFRNLQQFADEVIETEKRRNRMKTMQSAIVDDVLENERKFREQLTNIIDYYNIKVDLSVLEEETKCGKMTVKQNMRKIKTIQDWFEA